MTSAAPTPLKAGAITDDVGVDAVEVGLPEVEVDPVGVEPEVPPPYVPPVPVVPAKPGVPPELPVMSELETADGLDPLEPDAALPEFPPLPAAKDGEAVELTCRLARSSVSCWSLGKATGSCDVSDAGRSPATMLSGESSVLRSMLILRPSRVRAADGPLTVS